MRNLASIQEVIDICPIPDADQIERIKVLGWYVVTKKGQFNLSDKCIYIEIDSRLPDHPVFDFMRARKFKVKTIKLRKQISQGICFPVDILSQFGYKGNYSIGEDVTEILGITKIDDYDPEETVNKTRKSKNIIYRYLMRYEWFRKLVNKAGSEGFPSNIISKTDETRIQSIPQVIADYKKHLIYITEKIDGSSATYFILPRKFLFKTKYEFYVCSRNIRVSEFDKNNNFVKIAEKYKIKDTLINLYKNNRHIAIQGEVYGESIQGNRYNISGVDFAIFNIKDLKTDKYLEFDDFINLCDKMLIPHVPLLYSGTSFIESADQILEYAIAKSKLNNKVEREGVVVRCQHDTRQSFKAVSNKYLLEIAKKEE